jgi:predicted enzyme related to lactoylglutathione lyase
MLVGAFKVDLLVGSFHSTRIGASWFPDGRRRTVISGGNATIFISDMDAAVDFYTSTLGLKLTNRFGDAWATIEAGKGLTIGLHPASPKYPAPGTKGAMVLGLEIDEPIETVVARLSQKGVSIKGSITEDDAGKFASLEDPDGNQMYLWQTTFDAAATSV